MFLRVTCNSGTVAVDGLLYYCGGFRLCYLDKDLLSFVRRGMSNVIITVKIIICKMWTLVFVFCG